MARIASQQLVLKPQDLFVLLALHTGEFRASGTPSYPELAKATGLAPSAVHAALKRAAAAGLATFQERRPVVLKPQLREFAVHGARYAFPPVQGPLVRGVPTAYAAPPLNSMIVASADPVPVWPHKSGEIRGVSLSPLYPTVPGAALRNQKLYELLALFDALRSGRARERNLAQEMLEERLQ